MPGRDYSSSDYRYGFQGQEVDKEMLGGAVSYKYRVHDARIGRFLSVDPLTAKYPHYSPYSFSGNKVIAHIELEGLEALYYDLFFDDKGEPVLELVSSEDHWYLPEVTDIRLLHPETCETICAYTFTNLSPGYTDDGKKIIAPGSGNSNSLRQVDEFLSDPLTAINSGKFATTQEMLDGILVDIIFAAILAKTLSSGGPSMTWKGKAYRYERSDRLETTWDQHEGNINASHRYSKTGEGATYGGTTDATAKAEMDYYEALPGRVPTSKYITLNKVLDLTDPKVRKLLGVKMKDLTSNDYKVTQRIGTVARENGYDGILAPSARNEGGTNIIILGEQ